jgi:hypothetical protein
MICCDRPESGHRQSSVSLQIPYVRPLPLAHHELGACFAQLVDAKRPIPFVVIGLGFGRAGRDLPMAPVGKAGNYRAEFAKMLRYSSCDTLVGSRYSLLRRRFLRVGLTHYNTAVEVHRFLAALQEIPSAEDRKDTGSEDARGISRCASRSGCCSTLVRPAWVSTGSM